MASKRAHDKAIKEYFDKVKDVDSVFGRAKIFNVPLMGGKCVVFGPSEAGDHVYIYKLGDCEAGVSYCQTLQFFKESRDELIALMEDAERASLPGSNTLSRAMYGQVLIHNLYEMLDGREPSFDAVPEKLGELFGIEGVTPDGGDLTFEDLEGNAVFGICGSTDEGLRIELPSGEVLFEIKNEGGVCIIRKNGEEYAKFQKGDSADVLETRDGAVSVLSLEDIIGKSLVLYLDGEIIGTICTDLNAGFVDVIRHAHAIHVRHPEHTGLVALLATVLTGIKK